MTDDGPDECVRDSLPPDLHARDEAFERAARACLALWEDVLPLQLQTSDSVLFNVCFPLAAHALNQVAAALELQRRFPLVAAGNARIGLEHAVASQWVLFTQGGAEQLVHAMEYQYMTRAQAFSDALGHPTELEDIDAMVAVDGRLRSWNIGNVMNRFADSGLFYDRYRELSQAIHPSYATLQAHTDIASQHMVSRVDRSGRETEIESVPETLGLTAVLAMDTVERLRAANSRLDKVEAIAAAAGLPANLAVGDTQPHLWPTSSGGSAG